MAAVNGIACGTGAPMAGPPGTVTDLTGQPTGLIGVRQEVREMLPLGEGLGWLEELTGGLVAGGVYLLSGSPGGGKSRLATQVCLALGLAGVRSLTVLTEEPEHRLLARARQMTADWTPADAERAMRMMHATSEITDIEELPYFISFNVTRRLSALSDVRVIVLDSIQGDGLAPGAHRKYQRLYDFTRNAKAYGVAVVAIGHLTKAGKLAGPRGLEHHVDAVWRVERAGTGRLLAVVKNRFGREHPRGLPLVTSPVTSALSPSPHREPATGVARTFLGGQVGQTELQAQVGLPLPGQRPQITAPGLPRRRIEQLVRAIVGVPVLGLEDLDVNLNTLLPGDATYRSYLGLPLAISLVASLTRRSVPEQNLYLGEVDLGRAIRPLPAAVVESLVQAASEGRLPAGTRLVVPPATAQQLDGLDGAQLVACATLDQAILATWPDLH